MRLGGQVIKISPNSTQYINPMDINDCYSEEDNPVALKSDFILSLCELIVGGKEGLQAIEKTVIDRCVHQIYQRYFEHPTPENMPILEDLYHALLAQEEKEAHHVATALEIYVKGSLNLFNHRTNVDIENRLVCYTDEEIRAVIAGKAVHRPKQKSIQVHQVVRFSLIFDLQQKLAEKGPAYERWASVFNLKQMASVMLFLNENHIDSMEDLVTQAEDSASP